VLTRSYVDGASTIMLLIAYDSAQSGMLQIHRPEACYPASGYALSGGSDYNVPLAAGLSVPGQRLTATNGERVEQILYWTRIGDAFPTSYDGQRQSVAGQNLRGLIPDGALIRMSTINRNAAVAQAQLLAFAQQMFVGMDGEGRALLAGPLNAVRLARTA
jgi:EpsI family protein